MPPIEVLGIVGALRANSYNRKLLHAAIDVVPTGVVLRAWDGLKTLPPFDEDDECTPGAEVERLRRAIARANALLLVTPEYNGSLPGQLKNALDWASRPREGSVLHDMPVAVIGASPSPGGARTAQADARRVLTRAGARVIPDELAVPRAYEHFDAHGRLKDAELQRGLAEIIVALAAEVRTAALVAA